MRIRSIFFDIGETIVDESREYGTWADWLGVPRHTFSGVFGAVIARGLDYREAFQAFQPGFDLATERRRRAEAGRGEWFDEEDLYPDVRPCLEALRAQGLRVGLAGNQTARAEEILRDLQLPIDVLGTSDGWEVEKPAVAFFERVVVEASCSASEVLYVGDRLDNDIQPAQLAGLSTAWIRRGPWGYLLDSPDVVERCLFRLDSLTDLPPLVADHNAST